MSQFMQASYLDPFAARNAGANVQNRAQTPRQSFDAAPPAAADCPSIRWWVVQYETAGRALLRKAG